MRGKKISGAGTSWSHVLTFLLGFFFGCVSMNIGSMTTMSAPPLALQQQLGHDPPQKSNDIQPLIKRLEQSVEKFETIMTQQHKTNVSKSVATVTPDLNSESYDAIRQSIRGTLAVSSAKGEEKDFYEMGKAHGTDKVHGPDGLLNCMKDEATCVRKGCARLECRAWGHFYHTLYQQRIGKYSLDSIEPFQFLEIGFFHGHGFELYRDFLSDKAEVHSIEISCGPKGPLNEDKWPYDNVAKLNNKNYEKYRSERRLHCGSAFDVDFLDRTWKNEIHRPDAPPLKIVVDDGSHLSIHMVQSFFFWFPRIEPGGVFIVEDIQPINESNLFRTQFLPQIMSDLHFCGDPNQPFKDQPCFPLLQGLLQSIHCEMHICIFERNSKPAIPDLPLEHSKIPEKALNAVSCPSIGKPWGLGLGL